MGSEGGARLRASHTARGRALAMVVAAIACATAAGQFISTAHAAADTAPPVLKAVAADETSIDVGDDGAAIPVTATISDDRAGVASQGTNLAVGISSIGFASPSGQQNTSGVFVHTSGDQYTALVYIPKNAETGTWTLHAVNLADQAGNQLYLDQTTLTTLGFSATFHATAAATAPSPGGASDVSAPTLGSLRLVGPSSVDVSAGTASVVYQATIDDDISGVGYASLTVRSPSGRTASGQFVHTSGDRYIAFVTIPRFAESGTWSTQYLNLNDKAGNAGFVQADQQPQLASAFAVTGTSDVSAPTLGSLRLVGPSSVDVSTGTASVVYQATIDDDISGVGYASLTVRSPSGRTASGQFVHTSGDRYIAFVTIPRFAESGTWSTQYLNLNDKAGNAGFVQADQQPQLASAFIVGLAPSIAAQPPVLSPSRSATFSVVATGPASEV